MLPAAYPLQEHLLISGSSVSIVAPHPTGPDRVEHVVAPVTYFIVLLFSTTLREAAHTWSAWPGGDRPAYHAAVNLMYGEIT